MSTFSSILDISSFFIGVLVNLLLVAMICFYFKRKIDNLEMSQSEQAKMMFQLIQQQQQMPPPSPPQTCDAPTCTPPSIVGPNVYGMLNGLDLSQLNDDEEDKKEDNKEEEDVDKDSSDDNDSDDDDDDDNDSDDDDDDDNDSDDDDDKCDNDEDDKKQDESKEEEQNNIKKIDYEEVVVPEVSVDVDVEKMTIKELRALLEDKGVSVQKKNMKKQELIDMYMKGNEEVIETVVKVEEVIEMNDQGELDISPSEEIIE